MNGLSGKVVLVTREEGAEGPLTQALRKFGAEVEQVSAVRTGPAEDIGALAATLRELPSFDWLFVTSARGARVVVDESVGVPRRIAAVGEATAAIFRERGWPVEQVGVAGALALAREMATQDVLGQRILCPVADQADPRSTEPLAAAGADVTRVVAYRTLRVSGADARVGSLIASGRIHALTFTSPSAAWVAPTGAGIPIAAIGTTTAAALRTCGIQNPIVASAPNMQSLAETLDEFFRKES